MMSSAHEHHDEAERLLALVRADVGDDYRGAADHVPALLAALVHATLATSTTVAVIKDRPVSAEGPARIQSMNTLVDLPKSADSHALPRRQEGLPDVPLRPYAD
jgi:hypothetical protein